MPGEFTASPRHPVTSEPLSSYTTATADASNTSSATSQSTSTSTTTTKPKSTMRTALSAAKQKILPSSHSSKGSTSLASSEEEFERMKKAETEDEKRKTEYKQYGLGSKGFGKGSMQMGG